MRHRGGVRGASLVLLTSASAAGVGLSRKQSALGAVVRSIGGNLREPHMWPLDKIYYRKVNHGGPRGGEVGENRDDMSACRRGTREKVRAGGKLQLVPKCNHICERSDDRGNGRRSERHGDLVSHRDGEGQQGPASISGGNIREQREAADYLLFIVCRMRGGGEGRKSAEWGSIPES